MRPQLAIAALIALAAAPGALRAQNAEIREWRCRGSGAGRAIRTWTGKAACGSGTGGNTWRTGSATSGQFRRFELEDGALPHNWWWGPTAPCGTPATATATSPDGPGHRPGAPLRHARLHRARPAHADLRAARRAVVHGAGRQRGGPAEPRERAGAGGADAGAALAPYGIVLDARGRPWFNLFGTKTDRHHRPRDDDSFAGVGCADVARSRRIDITRRETCGDVDYAGGMLGRYNPATASSRSGRCPAAPSRGLYAMAVDERSRRLVVERRAPQPADRLRPVERAVLRTRPSPSGGGAVRHMVFHKPTRQIGSAPTPTPWAGRWCRDATRGGPRRRRPPQSWLSRQRRSPSHARRRHRVSRRPTPGADGWLRRAELPRVPLRQRGERAGGTLSISGVPSPGPGPAVSLIVAVREGEMEAGGFQLAARIANAPNAGTGGHPPSVDERTQVAPAPGARSVRQHARPRHRAVRKGRSSGVIEWTAPANRWRSVVFHLRPLRKWRRLAAGRPRLHHVHRGAIRKP